MALIHRFSRLLSADLHAVMDRLEDPLDLLHQAQREMAAVIADQTQRLAQLDQSISTLKRQEQNASDKLAALRTELDLCLDDNNEPLARGVIKRQLLLQAELTTVADDLTVRQEQRAQLHSEIERQQQDLESIAVEAERLAERVRYQPQAPGTGGAALPTVTEEAIELALLAERRARGSAS